jgi:hypothetical protein
MSDRYDEIAERVVKAGILSTDAGNVYLGAALLREAVPESAPPQAGLFGLAMRMVEALREVRDGGPDEETALDLCVEWDMLDAAHDHDEWKRVHGEPSESMQNEAIISRILAFLCDGMHPADKAAAREWLGKILARRPESAGDHLPWRESLEIALAENAKIKARAEAAENLAGTWETAARRGAEREHSRV